jgi:murein DD-endopeptidase MepM/ murein hydrolase activator NlpD
MSTSTPSTAPSYPRGDERAGAPAPPVHSSRFDAQVASRRVFYYGRQSEELRYKLRGTAPQDLRIDVVRLATGNVAASWRLRAVTPGDEHTVRWNGQIGRRTAPAGSYDFRIALGAGAHARATGGTRASSGERSAGRFAFISDLFPIRGSHNYGNSANRFGAGRAGHTHQGQDVMAACGTRLVAVRGGRVRWRASQSAAGNYVVIDGANTSYDTVYMHLRSPALVKKGQRVYTGQLIGYVGDTGDATACHLHFELWRGAWYGGGHPIDPLPSLRAWDRMS